MRHYSCAPRFQLKRLQNPRRSVPCESLLHCNTRAGCAPGSEEGHAEREPPVLPSRCRRTRSPKVGPKHSKQIDRRASRPDALPCNPEVCREKTWRRIDMPQRQSLDPKTAATKHRLVSTQFDGDIGVPSPAQAFADLDRLPRCARAREAARRSHELELRFRRPSPICSGGRLVSLAGRGRAHTDSKIRGTRYRSYISGMDPEKTLSVANIGLLHQTDKLLKVSAAPVIPAPFPSCLRHNRGCFGTQFGWRRPGKRGFRY